jgi:hypothetical protein
MNTLTKITIVLMAMVMLTNCCPENNKNQTNQKDYVFVPEIVGDWWQVAGNPDLGEYTTEHQQPVDFGVWQATDGTWQLWSCIRHTNCGTYTRLFHGWEGKNLTDTMWAPLGIMMEGDTTIGEASGGLQAPHVIVKDDIYHMLYGDWDEICLATSTDGKKFDRVINEKTGTPALFKGSGHNTRDAMTIEIDGKFYCYYTDHYNKNSEKYKTAKYKAAMYCRTSDDLKNWSEPVMISAGGMVEDLDPWGGGDAECPFVVPIEDKYVLFRNQLYVGKQLNTQYCSDNPLDFGVGHDKYMVEQLPVAAPEIIKLDDQYYIAALMPDLDGIRIAKLKFVKKEI